MIKKTTLLATGLLTTSLILLSLPVMAASSSRWFEVEVYLFERHNSAIEATVKQPEKLSRARAINLTSSGGSSRVILENSHAQFSRIIARIKRQRGNRSLLHMTWKQLMQPQGSTRPIHLYGGKDFSGIYRHDGTLRTTAVSSPVTSEENIDLVRNTNEHAPIWRLDGLINIYLSHYLYVQTSLTLHKEGYKTFSSSQGSTDDKARQFPFLYSLTMRQNKRIKSGEIHYFDHPNMGMILQVRKIAQ